MGNTFFEPGEGRAAKVNELFEAVANRYDLLNDLQSFGLHRYWKKRVLQLANAGPGLRALDVCCGTGDLACGLAAAGGEVVGVDFSGRMLKVARQRAARLSGRAAFQSPQFVNGDAMHLPFEANSFEIVTIGYGLRNLASWPAGLRELYRVLKPGGRCVCLEFGKPPNAIWRSIYFGYLKFFVPCLGLVFCGNASAYSYILESLKHYPAQEGVAEEMRQIGFSGARIYNLLGGAMSINYGEKSLP